MDDDELTPLDGSALDLQKSVLGRAALLIEAFDIDRPLLSLHHLSERTGLPRSTVHRLAEQLVQIGWLERASSGYRLGMRLFELAGLVAGRNRLRERSLLAMRSLFEETGLSVHLAVLDQFEIVYLEKLSAPAVDIPVRLRRMPAYCTGLGKAMMAFAGDDYVEAVIRQGLAAQTEATITDADELRGALRTVQDTGIAFDREEAVTGFGCVAAPIRGAGRAIAAVSATGRIEAIDVERLAPLVRETATEIWSNMFSNRPRAVASGTKVSYEAASSLERAASAELNQW
ncbi:MAG: IclR family transcriptional regulator, partial [Actinobacteria bacterium]|nr:IclR family transcriptional regulator [Actinomycetota bacterium]